MSKDPEELELEALQRRLDDAFATTRPRRGFEDELWVRIQRRRPFGTRVRDFFGGLWGGIREAPAVPAGVAAFVVIVALGVGVVGPYLARGSHNSASSAGAPMFGGGADQAGHGMVPTPALNPGLVDTKAPVPSSAGFGQPALGSANLYFGPANLTWTGIFEATAASAPVLVYAEPKSAANEQFGPLNGVTVVVRPSIPQLPLAPTFILTEQGAGVASGTDPVLAASSFLQQHNALPPWPNNVAVFTAGGVAYVVYQRAFDVSNGGLAFLVDWNGDRYGTAVTIADGKRIATGPIPLGLQVESLPLITNAQAAQLAVSQPPASTQALSPIPTVNLDHVELVYALAIAGGNGFYEPAYLFSGTFTYNGQTYTKRVLVPLVVPSLRS